MHGRGRIEVRNEEKSNSAIEVKERRQERVKEGKEGNDQHPIGRVIHVTLTRGTGCTCPGTPYCCAGPSGRARATAATTHTTRICGEGEARRFNKVPHYSSLG